MDKTNALNKLREMFKDQDWYYDVGIEEFGRLVVYCNYMNIEVLTAVPDSIDGTDVLTWFAAYKQAGKEKYADNQTKTTPVKQVEVEPEEEEVDMKLLIKELDRLEKLCGSRTLQDIFYEVHDGPNAVTNLSARFPEVREGMQKLYKTYGFDLVYEEMDG